MAAVFQSLMRPLSKIAASVALLVMVGGTSLPASSVAAPAHHLSIADSGYYPIVHLRKLHLVRPDLIPYPIAYEIIC